ncbi:MAG TPA: phosphatidylserine decarboxylase [Candidatus Acidoferrum sp.]|nr:phosphatidylserine decarboxylase [Candidatus Acidoferrum sp.]
MALAVVLVVVALAALALPKGSLGWAAFAALPVIWVIFALFTVYFFRDPDARVPAGAGVVLAPGHGRVDAIGTTSEPAFMGGECQRVSIFLSVLDVHVQNAPISGKVAYFKYTAGKFLNALRADSALYNENVLLGFEASGPRGLKVGVRLIAGVIARRIVPFVQQGDEVAQGDRISLIQFGSRADVYLPPNAKLKVQLNDHAVGGETVLAVIE